MKGSLTRKTVESSIMLQTSVRPYNQNKQLFRHVANLNFLISLSAFIAKK